MNLILQTRLHKPKTFDNLILRPILLKELDNGLNKNLTLVIAPAGYGINKIARKQIEKFAE